MTYPRKLWRSRKDQPRQKVDVRELGRQVDELRLWPILEVLEGPGFLTAEQIGLLLYGDLQRATKVASSRLRRMMDPGLVDAFRLSRENQMGRGGSAPFVYCMTREGAQLLAVYRQVSLSDLHWYERTELVNTATVCHRLDLADCHAAVMAHCRQHGLALQRFQYEPRYDMGKGEALRPDALAEISESQEAERTWSLLIEIDRNTERPRKFAERVAKYEAFYVTREWERWLEQPPTVLVIVTEGGDRRIQGLREATAAALEGAGAKFRRWRFTGIDYLYQVGRSANGYTAPVATRFDQPVCLKAFGTDLVPVFGGGNE